MHIVWFKCGYCPVPKFFQFPKDLIAHKKTVHGDQFRRDRLQRQREKEQNLLNEKNSAKPLKDQVPIERKLELPQNEPPSSSKMDQSSSTTGTSSDSKKGIVKNGPTSWTLRSCEPPIRVTPECSTAKVTTIKIKAEVCPPTTFCGKPLTAVSPPSNLKPELSTTIGGGGGVAIENKMADQLSPRKKRTRKIVGLYQAQENGRSLTLRQRNSMRNKHKKRRQTKGSSTRSLTGQYRCRVCKIFCKNKHDLYEHTESHSSNNNNSSSSAGKAGSEKWNCRYCPKVFIWSVQRLSHEKQFHADQFKSKSVGRPRGALGVRSYSKRIEQKPKKPAVSMDTNNNNNNKNGVKKSGSGQRKKQRKLTKLPPINFKARSRPKSNEKISGLRNVANLTGKSGPVFQRNFQKCLVNKACPYISRSQTSREGKEFVVYSCNFCLKNFPRPSTAVIHTWTHTGKILDYAKMAGKTKNGLKYKESKLKLSNEHCNLVGKKKGMCIADGVHATRNDGPLRRFVCKFKDCRYFTMKDEKKLALHYTYTHTAPFVFLENLCLVFNAPLV